MLSINYAHQKGGMSIDALKNVKKMCINLFILGKLWFSVAQKDSAAFVDILAKYAESHVEGCPIYDVDFKCPAFYRHKLIWINPLVVIMEGVTVYVRLCSMLTEKR